MARTYPKIGSNTFMALYGDILMPRKTSKDITRPESEGDAFIETGTRGAPFEMTSVVFLAAKSNVSTQYATYRGLINTLVTVTDRFGQSHAYVFVKDVQILTDQTGGVAKVVGGNSTVNPSNAIVRLACKWTLQGTAQTT